jgi:hypothetical protein
MTDDCPPAAADQQQDGGSDTVGTLWKAATAFVGAVADMKER